MKDKVYSLTVLYPTSNQHQSNQSRDYTIVGTDVLTKNGTYQFFDGEILISCFPTNFTIITEIKEY